MESRPRSAKQRKTSVVRYCFYLYRAYNVMFTEVISVIDRKAIRAAVLLSNVSIGLNNSECAGYYNVNTSNKQSVSYQHWAHTCLFSEWRVYPNFWATLRHIMMKELEIRVCTLFAGIYVACRLQVNNERCENMTLLFGIHPSSMLKIRLHIYFSTRMLADSTPPINELSNP